MYSVEMEDIKKRLEDLVLETANLNELLSVPRKKESIEKLQLKMAESNFWQDSKESAKVVDELKGLKNDVDDWAVLDQKIKDLKELITIYDVSMEADILNELKKIEADCESLRLRILFSEKFDESKAIVEINSGAGGTEACDWAQILFRMYFRWAENKKFKVQILNEVRGEEAGIKNITFFVEGRRAYGMLKSEKGVHRLVRISPFDANKRRHTSFASVDVIPEIKEEADIQIKPEDLKIDTFRSSGSGGQHVNVTDSAVRITHISTGIVVACQNERSQHQNKQVALTVLKAKLYKLKEEEKKKELQKISGDKQRIEWGSQIRSYVLHPYLLVKDHRTDFESHNAKTVLDGEIDDFVYDYLKWLKSAASV